MYIEKKYHDETVRLWKKIKQEEEERKAALKDAEKAVEKAETEKEAEAFIRRYEKKQKELIRVVSPERMRTFLKMSKQALYMAELADMNICAKTTGMIGKIELVTDYFILNFSYPKKMRMIIRGLMDSSDDVIFHAEGNLMHLEFLFELCITV